MNGFPHCLYLNFRSLVFKLVLFVVVVAAALFVFGGLHFDLVLGLTHAFLAFLYQRALYIYME